MIAQDDFERYDRALITNSNLAIKAVGELLQQAEGQSRDEVHSFLFSAYPDIVAAYGERAAAVAVEFYDEQRELAHVKIDYDAEIPDLSGYIYKLQGDVSRTTSQYSELEKIVATLQGYASRRTYEYVDETITYNSMRDSAHPRWALVPHADACAWCVFLASQGFVYRTKNTVARHNHCRCTPTPEFDGGGLEGYDQDKYLDAYSKARDRAVKDARSDWESMSQEERMKYTRNGRTPSYDAYLRNRIVGQMAHDLGIPEHKH